MSKKDLHAYLDLHEDKLIAIAHKIWGNPEVGFGEHFAAKLQMDVLKDAGFRIKNDLVDLPTAFVAEYGIGKPIIGVVGEFDALPGLSQEISAVKNPVTSGAPGHACGHNALGTAGLGAVMALKEAMDKEGLAGTIRYYGCPAEELLAGKAFMAKQGVFDDLDMAFSWHPAQMNAVWGCSFLAVNSMKFHFKGIAAHAAAAPHVGRSALDAVELMNVGANYLREHVDEKARIHYSITYGGGEPNIVPPDAIVWYYIRAPKRAMVEEIYGRLKKIADGAALMTETTYEIEFLAGCYDVQPNVVLGKVVLENLREAGAPKFTDEDKKLAEELHATYTYEQKVKAMQTYNAPAEVLDMVLCEKVYDIDDTGRVLAGSTDVGDISYKVPFAQFTTATWPVGVAAHTWQAAAASGSGITYAAMLYAAKTLAGTVYDMLKDDGSILKNAKKEFDEMINGYTYVSAIPDGVHPKTHK